jgi:hypothetical protein
MGAGQDARATINVLQVAVRLSVILTGPLFAEGARFFCMNPLRCGVWNRESRLDGGRRAGRPGHVIGSHVWMRGAGRDARAT